MIQTTAQRAVGQALNRLDGPQKVTGAATYAYEHSPQNVAYGFPVQSNIARGSIAKIDVSAAQAIPGVLTVLTHENAPRLASQDDAELAVLQSNSIAYRGQFVAFVVAETLETARQAAETVVIYYREEPHDVVLRADREDLYKPEMVNTFFETDTRRGDVEAALKAAPVVIDLTYTTPAYHQNPLEPHATVATWHDGSVTLYDANQGAHSVQDTVAKVFGLKPEQVHVNARYIGGAFGSKGTAHPHLILTIMAAQVVERPVKFALTRQQMFAVVGYRTPTIQHLRLGAENDGHLTAISHDAIEQTATLKEFAEQVAAATRMMYATPNCWTSHRLAALDVPITNWMRAPGECPGMFALESAMDELAIACQLDPIELRIRNDTSIDPESGHPFSSRGLVACLQEGAERFNWSSRHATPGVQREGRWLIGTGVASSTYPTYLFPATATIRIHQNGQYTVRIDATDIGTGAWTILTQIAADALEVPLESIDLEIGDSTLPYAFLAGGSSGTASWGSAIVAAARELRARLQEQPEIPPAGLEVTAQNDPKANKERFAMSAFGAQFAEVRVNMDTGEVRTPRLLGVFAAGHIMNAKTARSQFLGGMTMGLSMALHEHSIMDPRTGDFVNHDLAEYHIATNADVGSIEISWIDEDDPYVNPLGSKGIGEIGIVGTAAAIANAVYNATGTRVRDLPITLDKLLI